MGNQATSLRPEVISDLETHTAFTADEIREYYRQFKKDAGYGRMSLTLGEYRYEQRAYLGCRLLGMSNGKHSHRIWWQNASWGLLRYRCKGQVPYHSKSRVPIPFQKSGTLPIRRGQLRFRCKSQIMIPLQRPTMLQMQRPTALQVQQQ